MSKGNWIKKSQWPCSEHPAYVHSLYSNLHTPSRKHDPSPRSCELADYCTPGVLTGRRPGNRSGVMIQLLCLVRMGTAYRVRRRINYNDVMLMNTEREGAFTGYQILINGLRHEISSRHNPDATLPNLHTLSLQFPKTRDAEGYVWYRRDGGNLYCTEISLRSPNPCTSRKINEKNTNQAITAVRRQIYVGITVPGSHLDSVQCFCDRQFLVFISVPSIEHRQ